MGCCEANNLIRMATILGGIAIVFVCIGFGTDYWIEKTVSRDSLSPIDQQLSNTHQGMARFYHKRHRGIIKECYPSVSSTLFLADADNVVDHDCFFIDFSDPKDRSISSDYMIRMNLLRTCLAMYVLGMVSVIIAIFIGMILCCLKSPHVAFIASIMCFFGGVLVLVSIVLFHATEFMETNESGRLGEMVFENQWNRALRVATDAELGYSYALAWIGVIFTIADGILYILAARALGLRKSDKDSLSSYASDKNIYKKGDNRLTQQVYDNPAMSMPMGYPTPMFFEGYPYDFQALPQMRGLEHGPSVYRMSDRESNDH